MERRRWEKTLTCFQAYVRGYLVRQEVRRARGDFEDIVTEIDGGLSHLEWRETVIPIPHFTDTDGPFLRANIAASKPSNPQLDGCASSPSPSAAATAPSSEERDYRALQEKTEAERDDSQTKGQASLSKDYFPSSDVTVDGEGQKESILGDRDGDSTTVWSSLELDMNYGHSHKGSQQYCLAQEVPCTPEALRLHRNTLTMELLWLQQAIDSRKKVSSDSLKSHKNTNKATTRGSERPVTTKFCKVAKIDFTADPVQSRTSLCLLHWYSCCFSKLRVSRLPSTEVLVTEG